MSFSVMPMSATAITLVKMKRPLYTWMGMNAALQDTGANGSKYSPIPKRSCSVKDTKIQTTPTLKKFYILFFLILYFKKVRSVRA